MRRIGRNAASRIKRGISCSDCRPLSSTSSVRMYTMNCSDDSRPCRRPGGRLVPTSPLPFRRETISTKSATRLDRSWPRFNIRDSGIWRRMCFVSWSGGSRSSRGETRVVPVQPLVPGGVRPTDTALDILLRLEPDGRSRAVPVWDEATPPAGRVAR